MASIQDIHALEERINDAVQEYLDNPKAYTNPRIRVWLNEDEMEYRAECIDEDIDVNEDEGIYDIMRFIHVSLPYREEIDNDAVSEVANSWVFLD